MGKPLPSGEERKFEYPATLVGTAGNVTIYYDPSLGAPGLSLAQQMLNAATAPYNDMQNFFAIAGEPVDVIIVSLSGNNDGSGWGYHGGCNFAEGGQLYLDATFAAADPLSLEVGLYVAELSESFMGPQGGGWVCNYSNGQGLALFCAEQETPPGTLSAFAAGPAWARADFPDWVTQTDQNPVPMNTPEDAVSRGCAIVYIYWMRSLGFTVKQIIQAAGPTLSDNYRTLTGKNSAYQDLRAALSGLSVTSDNPFGTKAAVNEVAAAARQQLQLDVFWIGPDGSVQTTWWNQDLNDAQWNALSTVAPAGSAVPGTAFAAVGRMPQQLDVFWIGPDGSVQTNWWNQNGNNAQWNVAGTISPAGSAAPGTAVAAVARMPQQLDVFWIGPDGSVQTIWWNQDLNDAQWNALSTVAPAGSAVPGTALAAVGRMPQQLDVFWIGPDGSVQTNWWNQDLNNAQWNALSTVAPAGSAAAGTTVAAVARQPQQLDVFWIGADGSVQANSWDNSSNQWHTPAAIAPAGGADGGG